MMYRSLEDAILDPAIYALARDIHKQDQEKHIAYMTDKYGPNVNIDSKDWNRISDSAIRRAIARLNSLMPVGRMKL